MRLATFIRENQVPIIANWESFARSLKPAAPDMRSLALRDHIHEILNFIADDIESSQTEQEQMNKSLGEKPKAVAYSAAETHAAMRLASGFDIDQMVSEYRALRASIVRLWQSSAREASLQDISDLTRLNESIDQELTESISHYTSKVDNSKNLFLGILGHDLRTPLSAAAMSAQLLPKIGTLNERQVMLSSQIVDCAFRASEIVTNLLDLTRARFGSGLPVVPEKMDMTYVARQLAEELRRVYPTHRILLDVSDDLTGYWDKARMGQVFSNLIGNAIQYGFEGLPVIVGLSGTETEIVITVHNEGVPIHPSSMVTIFESLTRGGPNADAPDNEPSHLGLGLYITKEIVAAHSGTITVSSSEENGTTFTVTLPRHLTYEKEMPKNMVPDQSLALNQDTPEPETSKTVNGLKV